MKNKSRADDAGLTFDRSLTVIAVIIIASVVGYGAWADLMVWIG
jgi:hypothetical protein